MKKIRGFVSFGLANLVVFLTIVSCATTNTGEKKLSKKEKIEQLSAEVKGLQQQLVKEGNAGKAYMIDLQKKLIKANAMCDSLYNTPILANAMVEGRLDIGDPFKEITIPAFSYEITPKLLVFPTDLMESKVSYSKSDKIALLSQLKGSLSESLTADRAKTKATVQEFEKELANRETLMEMLETTYAEEERMQEAQRLEEERLEREKLEEERLERERVAEKIRQKERNLIQNYKQVKIGKQIWLAENLDVDKFRNGDPIPHAITAEEWKKAAQNKQPAWCYYDNDPSNGEKFGKLYNWYAVNDPRGLAPQGWHVPSDEEWTVLIDFLGGKFGSSRTKMKSTDFWADNDESDKGTNESGFSCLPGGYRRSNGTFYTIGSLGGWWSSTEYAGNDLRGLGLYYYVGTVPEFGYNKGNGFSVRCLRD